MKYKPLPQPDELLEKAEADWKEKNIREAVALFLRQFPTGKPPPLKKEEDFS